jgi:NAD(P)-dependent dehydrogenase (short-subunit alcohol dehydrogenase family)
MNSGGVIINVASGAGMRAAPNQGAYGAAVLYLASPAAGWVTGQNLLVGGGRDGGRSVEYR